MESGVIAAIILGSVIAVFLLIGCISCFVCCRRRNKSKIKSKPRVKDISRVKPAEIRMTDKRPKPCWPRNAPNRSTLKKTNETLRSVPIGQTLNRSDVSNYVLKGNTSGIFLNTFPATNSQLKGNLNRNLTADQVCIEMPEPNERIGELSTISYQSLRHWTPEREKWDKQMKSKSLSLKANLKEILPLDKQTIEKMAEDLDLEPIDKIVTNPSKKSTSTDVSKKESFQMESIGDKTYHTIKRMHSVADKEFKPLPKTYSKDMQELKVKTSVTTQTYLKSKSLKRNQFLKVNELTGITDSDVTSLSSLTGTDVKPTDRYRKQPIDPIIVTYNRPHSSHSEDFQSAYTTYRGSSCHRKDHFENLIPRLERIIDISFDNMINNMEQDFEKLEAIAEKD